MNRINDIWEQQLEMSEDQAKCLFHYFFSLAINI